MLPYLAALLIGIVAGLRTMMPLAAVSWGARLGWLHLAGTKLAFLGFAYTPIIATVLAALELITDKLPVTPSRTVPMQFGARIVSGAFAGAAILLPAGLWIEGAGAGAVGAVIGTLAGARFRASLAATVGRDWPAALIEDVLAIGGAALILVVLR
jgi:uncharacterized membrane protein